MLNTLILGFSLSQWWRSATGELSNYYNQMDTSQWGIVASLFVVAGFLMLRTGNPGR